MRPCDPVDCSPPGSSVHGILQARTLEWVAISSSRGSSRPRDGTRMSCTAEILYCLSHQGTNTEVSAKQPLGNSEIKLSDSSSLICLSLSLSFFFPITKPLRKDVLKKKKEKISFGFQTEL